MAEHICQKYKGFRIVRIDGKWWIDFDYVRVRIVYCPYCGVRLEIKKPGK